MEYTHVGRLGLVVSRLCLGTMNFGPHTSEEDSHTILDTAVAHGINFVDTANVYGRHLGVGATEEIIGRWFDKGEGRRDTVVLATKVFGQMGDLPNESRLSKLSIIHQCEASLRRLRTDRIDLYQMQHIDREAVVGRDLGGDGPPQAAGQGPVRRIVELRRVAHRTRQRDRVVASVARPRDRAVRLQPDAALGRARGDPSVQEYGMGLIPYSPLAGGLLAGALEKVTEGRRAQDYMQGRLESERDQLDRFEHLCKELGERPADVALAWLLHQPAVTAPTDRSPHRVAALGVDACAARSDCPTTCSRRWT